MIRDIVPEKEGSRFGRVGRTRLLGWYGSFKGAQEAVIQNLMDIYDNDHEYAVIEEVEEGIWVACRQEWWYQWNEDGKCYDLIAKPDLVKHLINFGIG